MDNLVHLCKHHHRLLHEGGFQMVHEATGALSIVTPKGNRIYDYIEPVTSDRTLEAVSQQMEIDINSGTAIPNWHEGRMDLDMAVGGLYELSHEREHLGQP